MIEHLICSSALVCSNSCYFLFSGSFSSVSMYFRVSFLHFCTLVYVCDFYTYLSFCQVPLPLSLSLSLSTCTDGAEPGSLYRTSSVSPTLKGDLFCSTKEREIPLSVRMLSHYSGAGERNFSNFVISVRKTFEIFIIVFTLMSFFFFPTAKA